MKSQNIKFLFLAFAIAGMLNSNKAIAQGSVPSEVASIVKMNLEEGQSKL